MLHVKQLATIYVVTSRVVLCLPGLPVAVNLADMYLGLHVKRDKIAQGYNYSISIGY